MSPLLGDVEVSSGYLNLGMPAALRGRGLLVAFGFPTAAVLVLALWLRLHGATLTTSLPAVVLLIALTAVSSQISFVVSPRIETSPADGFLAAAALIGGPLVGACAGAAMESLNIQDGLRRRFAWGGADALEGFCIGLVGQQIVLRGDTGTLALAALGLATGMGVNWMSILIVALDRPTPKLWPQIAASWRTQLLARVLPLAPLAAFLFSYQLAPSLALALAAGLLLAVWLGNRVRLRLEQSLAEERTRARLDALTHAPNRYALTETLAAEHARVTRSGRPGSLCFLDLDLFRNVNNTYGYATGDQLLVSLYQRLRERLRASDAVFRWGGEEFVVLGRDQSELAAFAERLRAMVADQPFLIAGHSLALTCSVGAARLDESRPPDETLAQASRLVRIAKQRRNAVEVERPAAAAAARERSAQALLEAQ